MKNTKQAFTLVELIVVITILAILGTIAFISLQGYSADARNSKRTSDLNTLAGKMNIQQTEGVSLMSFVTDVPARYGSGTVVGDVSIGGYASTAADYSAGTVNHVVLGVKSTDFQDPQSNADYSIGVTTRKGGQFELASKMEDGANDYAAVTGTYRARTLANTATVTSSGTTIASIDSNSLNVFFKGDLTASGTVTKVSADLATLTLSAAVGSGTLVLAAKEVDALTGNAGISVTNNGTTLPY